jgi:hypothetical protein
VTHPLDAGVRALEAGAAAASQTALQAQRQRALAPPEPPAPPEGGVFTVIAVSGPSDPPAPPPARAPGGPSAPVRVRLVRDGVPLDLDVHPEAVSDLLLMEYLVGGWASAMELGGDLITATTALAAQSPPVRHDTIQAATSPGVQSPPLPDVFAHPDSPAEQRSLLPEVVAGREELRMSVIAEIDDVRTATTAAAQQKLATVRSRLRTDRDVRYGLSTPETPPTGAEGGSGSDAPATVGTSQPAALAQLRETLDELSELRRRVRHVRSTAYAGLEESLGGTQGGPGSDKSPDPDGKRRAAADAAVDAVVRTYLSSLGKAAGGEAGEPVIATLHDRSDLAALSDERLRVIVWSWLTKTERHAEAVAEELARPAPLPDLSRSVASRIVNAHLGGPFALDTPCCRALFAARGLGRSYVPLSDEALLLARFHELESAVATAKTASEEIAALFRVRVCRELIEAIDTVDAVEAAETGVAMAPGIFDGLAGVAGVLAVVFPPLAGLAMAAGLAALGVQVWRLTVVELPAAQRQTDSAAASLLVGSAYGDYAAVLADRPTLLSVLSEQALGLLITSVALGGIEKLSRGAALALSVASDAYDVVGLFTNG